jgi:hypothetical protein
MVRLPVHQLWCVWRHQHLDTTSEPSAVQSRHTVRPRYTCTCSLLLHCCQLWKLLKLCRFCAGYLVAMAEMKVLLALLARGYDIECDTDTLWVQQVGQVPSNNLPMTVTRR